MLQELKKQIITTWHINHKINLKLNNALTDEALL